MPKALDPHLLENRHRLMLAYQEKIKPFTPVIRELCDLWGVRGTGTVHLTLKRMEEAGLVISRAYKGIKRYYAVKGAE